MVPVEVPAREKTSHPGGRLVFLMSGASSGGAQPQPLQPPLPQSLAAPRVNM